jgi:hypothetical protein
MADTVIPSTGELVPTNATTPEGQAAYEQYIMAPQTAATAVPAQVPNPFEFNLAAQAPVAVTPEIAAQELGAIPEYLRNSVGSSVDTAGTMRALQKGVDQSGIDPIQPPAANGEETIQKQVIPEQEQQVPAIDTSSPQYRALDAIAKAAEAKSVAEITALNKQNKDLGLIETAQTARRLQFEKDFKDKMDDVKKLSDGLDPDRYWANKTTGSKVLTAIGVMLGGIGAGLTRGPNMALEMLNKAIDRDMETQKQQIGQENNLLVQMRQKFQDDQSADTATRMLLNQKAQNELGKAASKYQGESAKQNAEIMKSQLQQQQAQLQRQLAMQQMMAAQASGNGQGLSAMQMAAYGMPKEWVDLQADVEHRSMPKGTDWVGTSSTKEGLGKFQEYINEVEPAVNGIKRIKDLKKNYNRFSDYKTRAQIDTEVASLVGALRLPITGPGILNDSERKMLNEIVGNPNLLFTMPSWQEARLAQIEKKLRSDMKTTGETYGFRKVEKIPDLPKKFKQLGQ